MPDYFGPLQFKQRDSIRKMRSDELSATFKNPVLEVEVTYFINPAESHLDVVWNALENYFTGSTKETYFRVVKRSEYVVDLEKETIIPAPANRFRQRYREPDYSEWDISYAKLYLIYVLPMPMYWNEYKAGLINQGLPESYADRIEPRMKDMLLNYGHRLSPTFFRAADDQFNNTWQLEHRTNLGKINIRLSPLDETEEPPRKKRRIVPLTDHQKALQQIAPSFYCREPFKDMSHLKKSVRNPQYITNKDTPYNAGRTMISRRWTGRAMFNRTWQYEFKFSGQVFYIPEGQMRLKKYTNARFVGKLGKVLPARIPTRIGQILFL